MKTIETISNINTLIEKAGGPENVFPIGSKNERISIPLSVEGPGDYSWADWKDIEEVVLSNQKDPTINKIIETMKAASSLDGFTDSMDGSEAHSKGVKRVQELAELISKK